MAEYKSYSYEQSVLIPVDYAMSYSKKDGKGELR